VLARSYLISMNDKRVIVAMALLLVLLMAGAGYWLLRERPVENRPAQARNLDLPQDGPLTNGTPLAANNATPERDTGPDTQPDVKPDTEPEKEPEKQPDPQPDALPNIPAIELESSVTPLADCDKRHYVVLRGTVVDHNNLPVADAAIFAGATAAAALPDSTDGPRGNPARAQYAEVRIGASGYDGRFEILLALAHSWDGFSFCELTVKADAGYATSQIVKVSATRDRGTHELELKILALGGISGRVVDETGVGVAGIRVQAIHEPEESSKRSAPSRTVSDDAGNFTFVGLAPGNYRVSVAHAIEIGKPETSLRLPDEYQPVKSEVNGVVVIGVITPLGDEPVVKLRTILVLTLELNGQPLATKAVSVEMHGGEVVVKSGVATDANGLARFSDPPEGTTRLTVTFEGCAPLEVNLPVLLPGQVNHLGNYVLTPN
jgi:hypothetical protein